MNQSCKTGSNPQNINNYISNLYCFRQQNAYLYKLRCSGLYFLDIKDRISYISNIQKKYLIKIMGTIERRSKMKHFKVVILIVAAVWFFASLTTVSYAEQRATGPIQKAAPVVSTPAPVTGTQTIKPLQQTLMLQGSLPPIMCPFLIGNINDVIKTAQTDIPKVVQTYTNQGSIDFPGTSENTAGVYRNYVQDCCSANKSFTVQDQKNAGCAGSDTVKLCMDKVIKYCISQYPQKNSLKGRLFESLQKSSQMSAKTKQLHDNVKQLYDMIP